ncbi:LOW QUALITY PROTEIN: hypothetical protein, conserved [Eimeria necatrix]|uniref:FUZ/MON1/HPS1 third Longin domain-containing protein n=1 Tax=Eimeria necatrix TaxID=51315 RepID=U6MIG9_9EIME|nr:LOW QUALITY PROTEIN: hypothetical protein, conserved [Eimeria necatrix]CDJ62868.1 hypothetical protein, conserved [Eimeria necatrix]
MSCALQTPATPAGTDTSGIPSSSLTPASLFIRGESASCLLFWSGALSERLQVQRRRQAAQQQQHGEATATSSSKCSLRVSAAMARKRTSGLSPVRLQSPPDWALSAIVSKLERFRGDKPPDVVRHFRCFGGRFVFLSRGPFYLALFDRQSINNSTARGYLMLLHRQLVCILTKEVERTLLIRPSFDVRPLMGGTDGIFRGLHRHYFHSMLSVLLPILFKSNCAAAAVPLSGSAEAAASATVEQQQQQQEQQSAALSISGAFEALPLSGTMRHIATTAVKNAPTPNVLASMLLAEQRVVSLSYAKGYELSPTDVCLLTNFMLTNTGCLAAIETSLEYAPYALPRCLWGDISLLHCALFVPSLSQYFSSAFGDEYKTDASKQQSVLSLYASATELIQNGKRPAHAYVETTDEKVYVWLTAEFFFFCCVPRWINVSTALVEQLAKWIREQQPFLFITDIPPLVHTPQQK